MHEDLGSEPDSVESRAAEAYRQLNELMELIKAGDLRAAATERAHLNGAITALRALLEPVDI